MEKLVLNQVSSLNTDRNDGIHEYDGLMMHPH
jgi:hypothetical protein